MAEPGRIAPQLLLCRGCRQFVRHDDEFCRFCGGDLAALQAEHEAREAELDRAAAALRAVLGGSEGD
ncbi:MAG TPA: hypothetical protein VK614_14615 [Allosphingosinicella sp.]|nr:hypothetical protein [Allosphingosinicella sp.]